MRRLLLLAALLLCALLGTAQPASAHTELVTSSPRDGATPAKAPTHLTLTFDEAVDLADVRVLTVDGDRLPVSRTAHRNVVRVALGSPADGRFALVWSVVDEEDGHASSGRIAFAVAAKATPTGGDEVSAPAPSPSVRKGLVAVRWTGYLALALFVGGLAFVALLWPGGAYEPRARALLGLAWTVGLLATVATAGLQGAYASLGGLRDALRPATYADVLATRPGVVLAARGLMWVLAAVVLAALLQGAARSPGWRVGALAVTFGLLRTTGMTGHNSEGSEPTWGAVADFVHLLGAALWIGGLAMLTLAVLPRRRPGELAEVVPGYARLAALSVTGIVGAGLVLAWQVVGSYDALLHTSYGQLLLVKTAVLGCVLVAAYASRQWVRTRLDLAVLLRGDAATVRPFGYSVAAETGLVLVVLAVTSLLVTADPGR
ncbi:copper resistance CopC/CopD family protein [Streptomyces griseorubiginosus]|uniref:copper resistance CopC/CopD family protein n=1 Tax=Streptomyces griseorubiginosus TaxID=67304 RepID=UPI002E823B1F|nr:copper resistance protein CopC [Streptomyces griseorubiginosus]WUB46597.1 copper resistance protein CopC [Streptomyces griseorubiginosus]WUB55118.1 copper resistance protein CopC [Streptomyces griseorubiginosus]